MPRERSKTVTTFHKLPDLSPRVSASFAGRTLVVKGEATDASLIARQRLTSSLTSLVSEPHSEMVTSRLARATCPMNDAIGSWHPLASFSGMPWHPSFGLLPERSRATCLPIPASTSPPFCRRRKVSTRALLGLSACTPARSPLFALVPNSVASGTAPTLLPSFVSPPRVFSSGLTLSKDPQASCP